MAHFSLSTVHTILPIFTQTATSGIYKAIYDTLDSSRSFTTHGLIGVGEVNVQYISTQPVIMETQLAFP